MKKSYAEKHRRRGRKPKLSIENQLMAALEYWREYWTYAHITASYGIAESNIYRSIKWIEDTLIKDGAFSLPGKKELPKSDTEYKVILIDATETPIEHPKKQRKYYSGKKKRHTLKTQLVTDKKTMKIVCLSFCNGKKHDFRLFKESGVHAGNDTEFETDKGYTEITAIYPNSILSKKRSKNKPLTKEEKRNNSIISKKEFMQNIPYNL